jgi:uncharacterized membrane protein (DUF485 family)
MDATSDSTSQHASKRTEWDRIAASEQFKKLLARKKAFIVPAFIFFFVYYFALPISLGYAPKLMATRVVGNVTLAYLFALSQFVVGGAIAWLYLRAAAKFDLLTKDVLEKFGDSQGGG